MDSSYQGQYEPGRIGTPRQDIRSMIRSIRYTLTPYTHILNLESRLLLINRCNPSLIASVESLLGSPSLVIRLGQKGATPLSGAHLDEPNS